MPANIVESPLERSVLTAVPFDASVQRPAVTLAPQSPVWIVDDGSPLGAALVKRLRALDFKPKLVSSKDLKKAEAPSGLAALILLAGRESSEASVKEAFQWAKLAGPELKLSGNRGGAALLTVTRFDGTFGLAGLEPEAEPLAGALAGLAKTAGREWPEVSCKALDASPRCEAPALAAAVVEELFLSGPTELGLAPDVRRALALVQSPAAASGRSPIGPGELVVITGGARGVTAEAALALAAFKPVIALIGRTPLPQPEPDWLRPLSEEREIKKALLAQSAQIGGKALAPKQIEEHYKRYMANREVLRNIERIEAAGAKVLYRCVDVREESEVRKALDELRREAGPVRGLIHGAGVLADRLILDKTAAQFDSVFDTKVSGLRNLLKAAASDDLRFIALFGSITGRLGRIGQSDYAMANEVLNKTALLQAKLRPACRVVSVNWGPWDGGMVTPALKKIFQAEGVGVVGLKAGARQLVAELSAPAGSDIEVVVRGALASAEPAPALTVAFERSVDVANHPFLASHVINGRAVAPLAMMVEWLSHGALHENPGFVFHGVDDLRVLKGVILDEGASARLRVMAGKAKKEGGLFIVPVELRSGDVLHARARVVLANRLPAPEGRPAAVKLNPYPRTVDEAYRDVLFHGPDMKALMSIEGCSPEGITAMSKTAPAPIGWIREPLRSSWLADPLALDAAFQAMILWSREKAGAGCLPCYIGRYRQYRGEFPKAGVKAVVRVLKNGGALAAADIDFVDAQGELVARLEGTEHTIDASLNEAFAKRTIAAA